MNYPIFLKIIISIMRNNQGYSIMAQNPVVLLCKMININMNQMNKIIVNLLTLIPSVFKTILFPRLFQIHLLQKMIQNLNFSRITY